MIETPNWHEKMQFWFTREQAETILFSLRELLLINVDPSPPSAVIVEALIQRFKNEIDRRYASKCDTKG